MHFCVYHADTDDHDIRFRLMMRPEVDWLQTVIKNKLVTYKLVAEVECISLSDVFRLTNTLNYDWWLNREVTARFQGTQCRSTSVGDVVTFNGQAIVYAPMGTQRLNYDTFRRSLKQ